MSSETPSTNTSTHASTPDKSLAHLLAHNRQWAADAVRARPDFFTSLMNQQQPQYMWIGCSDSRVPANQITGLEPGEVFVHRNVANLVVHSDLNMLSTVQYAVDQLKVEHLMVVGHYGCGGVWGALKDLSVGLADNWLRHIKDVRDMHQGIFASVDAHFHHDVLCELNVINQAANAARTTVVQDAWKRGQALTIHGWVYGLKDGLLEDLRMSISSAAEIRPCYDAAVEAVRSRVRTLPKQ